MALLKDEDRKQLQAEFKDLTNPVKLMVFTQERECQYCQETRQIAEELAGLSAKISLEVYDLVENKDLAEKYNIDKIPATVVLSDGEEVKDYNIRFFGIPSGYEFATLIQDITMVSQGDSGLSKELKGKLAKLDKELHLQVFVTPTCPYCPQAVHLAHQMAFENRLVRGDMVEAIEFPHLSNKYQVQGVPRTVINEVAHLEGAAPEQMLWAKVEELLAN